ncbi:hypothetical protein [Novosphingobium huizhouense]|uniref:hypothetical protein n=1 Tax=Novosphingobium huizhouense TaxID=2866625 RepID=UPI001CD89869|nr:hypothetical protein [Novosphingobium huizhouense]
MDLNHLLYQQQVAILRKSEETPARCSAGFDLVRHYQRRIDRLREDLGATGWPEWCAAGPGMLA